MFGAHCASIVPDLTIYTERPVRTLFIPDYPPSPLALPPLLLQLESQIDYFRFRWTVMLRLPLQFLSAAWAARGLPPRDLVDRWHDQEVGALCRCVGGGVVSCAFLIASCSSSSPGVDGFAEQCVVQGYDFVLTAHLS